MNGRGRAQRFALRRVRDYCQLTKPKVVALLLLTAETFTYATGAPAGVATMWRRAGAIAAVIPAPAKAIRQPNSCASSSPTT